MNNTTVFERKSIESTECIQNYLSRLTYYADLSTSKFRNSYGKLLFFLSQYQAANGLIYLNTDVKKQLANDLIFKNPQTITNMLGELINSHLLLKVGRSTVKYPQWVFRGVDVANIAKIELNTFHKWTPKDIEKNSIYLNGKLLKTIIIPYPTK